MEAQVFFPISCGHTELGYSPFTGCAYTRVQNYDCRKSGSFFDDERVWETSGTKSRSEIALRIGL